MREQLPIFPLNAVMFPGVSVPLHVFEDRYRALVHHLLTIPEKPQRLFGIVAIREGFEVGTHGVQSVHRVGCVVQMTSVDPYPDGRFDIEVVGRHRLRLDGLDTSGPYLVGDVETLPDPAPLTAEAHEEARRARAVFEDYRARLSELRGDDVLEGDLPKDPELLSYSLAATCLLTLSERQELLEAATPLERLAMLRHALREEMRAMRAIPSLPATEVARTAWSPN
ncbi:LON peptidase substrate-binding domain-containing protein [Nocardioides mesophilus]|uniref:LON peptidase substrate-binding domain-containing protein n=1 Tax=Nocardioides mesophilus TaxID=433659 RepID=A0A7G9RBU8_9ACTN|nr:LON peptidase substrate-binding domain-containing protein [Nocardioides mesophilus]QNN53073.1 LON peptidase substrate-binding domain-containing protein [Nocardioides mesophilus]